MTRVQIDTLVRGWAQMQLDDWEDERVASPPWSHARWELREEGFHVELDVTQDALTTNHYGLVADEMNALLQSNGLPLLDHRSNEYRRLAQAFLLAKQDVLREEMNRWEGNYSSRLSSVLPPLSAGDTQAAAPAVPVATKLFSEVVNLYFQEHKRAARTDSQIRAGFLRFLAVIGGDRPIGDITKADCRLYKEALLKSVGIATANKYLHSLAHLWGWAQGQGFVPDERPAPVKGLLVNKRLAKRAKRERKPFLDEDLAKILGHPDFKAQRAARPERYFLILALLLSGARREEIAQLALSDIREEAGCVYFDITNEGEE